jgi:hypothetical protein
VVSPGLGIYKYDESLHDLFMEAFDALPLAATVSGAMGTFFCVHGGISPYFKTVIIDRFGFFFHILSHILLICVCSMSLTNSKFRMNISSLKTLKNWIVLLNLQRKVPSGNIHTSYDGMELFVFFH